MKKLIPILFVFMLIMSLVAIAQSPPVPSPVRGYLKVDGQTVSGYVIQIENLRTDEVISGDQRSQLISEKAGFAFDLLWFEQGALGPIPSIGFAGGILEVRVKGISNSAVRIPVPYSFPAEVTIDLLGRPELVYVCSDGQRVASSSLCPVVEPVEVIKEVIVVKEVIVEVVEDEPVDGEQDLYDNIFQLAIKILAAFGFGLGFLGLVNYYWKGGQKIRAIKMLNTAIRKALLGKYDKYKK